MGTRFIYSNEQLSFLETQYKKHRVPALTLLFNNRYGLRKSPLAIKSALKNHKFVCGRPPGFLKGERPGIFSAQQEKYIRKHYSALVAPELAIAVNRQFDTNFTCQQIRTFVHKRGINCGRTGRFEEGSKPWNTGTKGLVKPNAGNFKKGNMPLNVKPMGNERIDKDGCVWMKVQEPNPHTSAPTRYAQKHRYLWEQANGSIPDAHALLFLDSDKNNCDPDNLVLITRAQLLYLNQHDYINLPTPELRETMRAIAKLECSRFEKMKAQT